MKAVFVFQVQNSPSYRPLKTTPVATHFNCVFFIIIVKFQVHSMISHRTQSLCSSVCWRASFKMATANVEVCGKNRSNSQTNVTNTVDVSASELLCGKLNIFYIDLLWFVCVAEHNCWELSRLAFHMPSQIKLGRIDDHLSNKVSQITSAG